MITLSNEVIKVCANCGWRKPDIPPNISAEVTDRLGMPSMGIDPACPAKGKVPLSGNDRRKKRLLRLQEASRQ